MRFRTKVIGILVAALPLVALGASPVYAGSAPSSQATAAQIVRSMMQAYPSVHIHEVKGPDDTYTDSFSLTQPCGGVNGNIEVYNVNLLLQTWGIVWENGNCGSGEHEFWLEIYSAVGVSNIDVQNAGPGQSEGFDRTFDDPATADATASICSSIGSWHCGPSETFTF
jgi:hypothetical protein